MQKVIGAVILLAVGAVAGALWRGGAPSTTTQETQLSRTADGKPDLNGIWQALGTAHWDLEDHSARSGVIVPLGAVGAVPAGKSVVEGGERFEYRMMLRTSRPENFNRLATSLLTQPPVLEFRISPTGD